MQFINISGVPMSGKSTIGKNLTDKLNQIGQKTVFIEVDNLISDTEKTKNKEKANGNEGLELKLNEDTKRKHLIDLINKYAESGEYSAVVFSCLIMSDFHNICKDLYGKNYKSISLVPPLNALLKKRGDRAPTKGIKKLVKQMYTEWGLDKPKTADLIIDNSKITIEQCVNGIVEFLQTGKTKIANKNKSLKNATINMINRLKSVFLRNNNMEK